jgi:hypothetical protein
MSTTTAAATATATVTAQCDSCNQPNCEFNRSQPEICSKYSTEIKTETRKQGQETQIRFHCIPNGLISHWYKTNQDSNETDPNKYTEAQAAQELHCRIKDVWKRAVNYNHEKELGDLDLEELNQLSKDPNIEVFLLKEVHKTVSHHDDHIIRLVFYAGISAYASPINIALKCESGSGKTYSTVQTLKFLPPEDIQMIGSQSPKVVSHDNGVLLDASGVEIEDPPKKPRRGNYESKEAYEEAIEEFYKQDQTYHKRLENSHYEIVLSNKIFAFLESIPVETFMMLKSTLSHDNEQIDHKYVDDRGNVHVTRLIGFPTAIFNSTDNEYMSEFATRTLTAAPTTTQPKIKASMDISNKKSSYPFAYQQESRNKKLIRNYIRQIRDLIKQYNIKPLTPFPTLHDQFTSIETRDMRDFNHFLELVPAFSLFKLFQRPILTINGENYLLATIQDILDAKTLFDSVSLTTKTSTEKRVLEFYYNTLKPIQQGATLNTLTGIYNKNGTKGKRKKVSTDTIRKWLKRLIEIEWVDVQEGLQEDKHTLTYFPLQAVTDNEAQTQLNMPIECCVPETQQALTTFCQNDFKNWLLQVIADYPPTQQKILQFNGEPQSITIEEAEEIVCRLSQQSTIKLNNQETGFNSENNQEASCIPEKQQSKSKHADIEKIGMLKPSEIEHGATCPECSFPNQVLEYEATRKDGSKLKVCTRCGDEVITESQGEVF